MPERVVLEQVPEPYWSQIVKLYDLWPDEAEWVANWYIEENNADQTKRGWWADIYEKVETPRTWNEAKLHRVSGALVLLREAIKLGDETYLEGE